MESFCVKQNNPPAASLSFDMSYVGSRVGGSYLFTTLKWREERAAAAAFAKTTPTMTSTAMSSGGGPLFQQSGCGHICASATAAFTVMRGQPQQCRTTATAGNLPFAAMIRVDTRDGRGGSQRHRWLLINYIIISSNNIIALTQIKISLYKNITVYFVFCSQISQCLRQNERTQSCGICIFASR